MNSLILSHPIHIINSNLHLQPKTANQLMVFPFINSIYLILYECDPVMPANLSILNNKSGLYLHTIVEVYSL